MSKVSKTFRIEESTIKQIQEMADSEFQGNATAAIESMINQAYVMRKVDMRHRYMMYDLVKRDYEAEHARSIIDGLHI